MVDHLVSIHSFTYLCALMISIVYAVYTCSDGLFITVGALEPQFFSTFM